MRITNDMIILHTLRLMGKAPPCKIYRAIDKTISEAHIRKMLLEYKAQELVQAQPTGRNVFYALTDKGYLAAKACSILVELNS